MRVAESLVSFRLLKVCRYYEGAQLLTRACVQAAGQLLVPLFMLLILVYNFSSLLFEVEWEQDRPAAAGSRGTALGPAPGGAPQGGG